MGDTFPALQCTRIGWFRLSRMVSRAPMMEVSGITTKGSLFPGMGNWKNCIPADSRNARFSSGYSSCTRVLSPDSQRLSPQQPNDGREGEGDTIQTSSLVSECRRNSLFEERRNGRDDE